MLFIHSSNGLWWWLRLLLLVVEHCGETSRQKQCFSTLLTHFHAGLIAPCREKICKSALGDLAEIGSGDVEVWLGDNSSGDMRPT